MKYFTRDWYDERGPQTPADYFRYLESIHLTEQMKKMAKLNFHDSRILDIEDDLENNNLRIRFRCGDLQVGYFDANITFYNASISPADAVILAGSKYPSDVEILYEEIDRTGQDRFELRLLFYPKNEIAVQFDSVKIERKSVPNRDC